MQPSLDEPQKKRKSLWAKIWKVLIAVPLLVIGSLLFSQFGMWGPHHKPSLQRAVGEIKGMMVALEAYKADHGHYPTDPNSTEQLQANASSDATAYIASSAFLYRALAGNPHSSNSDDQTVYFPFPASMLKTDAQGRTYIVDPWGNSYGYSTFKAAHPNSHGGYNTTFDLWSTGGEKEHGNRARWIFNWENPDADIGH